MITVIYNDTNNNVGGVIKWVDCCQYLGVFSLVIVPSSVILIMQSRAFSEHLMLCMAKLVD